MDRLTVQSGSDQQGVGSDGDIIGEHALRLDEKVETDFVPSPVESFPISAFFRRQRGFVFTQVLPELALVEVSGNHVAE